jgi:acetylornithine/N-succinyldiaminopimelate aminotransferase
LPHGLDAGIELGDSGVTSIDVVKRGIEAMGELLLTAKQKVRLLPPLSITREEIDCGLDALEKALVYAVAFKFIPGGSL